MKRVYLERVESPMGGIWLMGTGRGVCSVRFERPRHRVLGEVPASPSRKELVAGGALLRRAARQIREYLENERRAFTVRLDLSGLPALERSVLAAVRRVPYGETTTYASIAERVRDPRGTRRIQSILAANPLPLLIPCHRVVGVRGWGHYVAGRSLKARLVGMEQGQMTIRL